MKQFSILIFISLLLSSCIAVKKDPIQQWWNEPQTAEQIEKEYDQFLSKLIPSSQASRSCINYSAEEEIKLSRGRIITVKRCNQLSKYKKSEISAFKKNLEAMRLIHQPEWKQMKSDYTDGDDLRTYSAPPFQGGFGIVLVRDGKIIQIYQQSFK